ncbi:hypothetical protein [Saccharothrix deserti]|uniref:hypothetical protein n=1 Tax=Saccharothrix deserti TaxID=2593674 RepID=UPI00131C9715|nr:hypothetical protein [Saccharothrix deserti]
MVVDQYQQDPYCRDAVRTLAAEFSGRVPRKVVARTVVGARQDLQGQIQPEALAEMLHRLAHHRLDTMITAST